MLSWLKSLGIRAADIASAIADPFEEFYRPMERKYGEALYLKAQRFEADYLGRFVSYGGMIFDYRRPPEGQTATWDVGDQALWHGVMTAAWAFKYAVTQDPAAAQLVRQGVFGLQLHQTIHGEPKPRLVRGVYPDGKFQDNCSNDSATGHLAGIYFAWRYGPAELRGVCCKLIQGLAAELADHDYALVGADGKPTTFGALIRGPLTDPLRLTLALAIFGAAHMMTGEPYWYQHFWRLYTGYYALVPYPKVRLLWLDTQYDTHRAAIHLSILADMKSFPPVNEPFDRGIARLWEIVHKNGNVWVQYLLARHMQFGAQAIICAKKVLSEFCVEDRGPDTERINSTRPEIRKVLWNGRWMAAQPLPRWQVANQDFFWRCELHALDDHLGNKMPSAIYSGMDYLAAYWLGRLTNCLGANE